MPGSNKPRPASARNARPGRPPGIPTDPRILEQRAQENTEDLVLFPPTVIIVEGRCLVKDWSKRRHELKKLEEAAQPFGLSVLEVAAHGGRIRRRYALQTVDLELAYLDILESPGISFEGWMRAAYSIQADAVPAAHDANRKRAIAGLFRLIQRGDVMRLKNADGTSILWPLKSVRSLQAPPVPPELLSLRANLLRT